MRRCWRVFLAGEVWLNSGNVLGDWLGFLVARISSSISSGGNSCWLPGRSLVMSIKGLLRVSKWEHGIDCSVSTL